MVKTTKRPPIARLDAWTYISFPCHTAASQCRIEEIRLLNPSMGKQAKIKKMDEEKIEQLCPSIVTLSYSDALKAYDRISQGMFLPELKVNTLEMIKRRLTRLKTDESVQLMRKLKHDLEESLPTHYIFYYYNA